MIFNYNIIERTICLLLFLQVNTVFCQDKTSLANGKKNAFSLLPSKINIPVIEKEWENGNPEAGAELSFALAIGAGVDLDLHNAIEQSTSLLDQDVARAYTTLGLLLNHNLTETNLDKNERENKSMKYFILAASQGDPLAQMIVGEYYFKTGDCMLAVNYYRHVSSLTAQNTLEMHISKPNHVRHVWEEDNIIPVGAFPTQEQLDYLEYVGLNEPDAALKAASLRMSNANSIEKDLNKAQLYLRKAIEANSTTGMIWLAQMYLRNEVDGDDTEALKLLEQALEYGDNMAHSGLGRIYMGGRAGVTKNYSKAEYHFKMGVDVGNMDSFYQLGKLYMMKEGPGTLEEAIQLLILPSTLGHVHAAWSLADYYRKNYLESSFLPIFSKYTTALVPKVCDLALFLYRSVAQAGEYFTLFDNAFEDYTAGRKGAALMKYLLLSDLGYSSGHINAARILDEGTASIYDSDMSSGERAFEMWRRAANSGESKGNVRLGDYYYYGLAGKDQNYTTSFHHYKKAYLSGDAEGGFSLAHATEWGEGTKQDVIKAQELYIDVLKKYSEALAPTTLALIRLRFFAFIKETFNINLYYHCAWNVQKIFHYLQKNVKHVFSWDYLLMLLLVIYITTKLYYRGR